MLNYDLTEIIAKALEEDIGSNDITTESIIDRKIMVRAGVFAKQNGVIAGTEAARNVFVSVDPSLIVNIICKDSSKVKKGDIILEIKGSASSILMAERVSLNFLQKLSGIATYTAKFVERVKDLPVKVLDTRKTSPGMRSLEKGAVLAGGGFNHRKGLYDGILLKENHLLLLKKMNVSLNKAIELIREKTSDTLKIEVEVESLDQIKEVLEAKSDIILLDNMNINEIRRAVKIIKGQVPVEVSGNVSLENIRNIAKTGVNMISVGRLTHSAPAFDMSLKIIY